VVVSDCVALTDTSQYADILLPAQGWGEKDGTVTNSERRISHQRAFLESAGEAKADWWIVSEVAKRMGFAEAFDYPDAAAVSTGNLRSLAKSDGWSSLGEILGRADRTRGYGDFYHYHLLAAGKIEAVIESDVNILDIAALAVIVTEAGGRFTDLNGAPPGLATRSVLAANPALHAIYLDRLDGLVT
jgi:anaerobic selenocysteine-containing dehydrogenase